MPLIAANDGQDTAFADFFRDKLRPVIEDVGSRRRTALTGSLLIGVATAVVFGAATYLFLSPYAAMMGEHNISYWPLLVLLPVAMGIIAFSISYILRLRTVVGKFREELVGRMTEHIDSGILHEPKRPMPETDLQYGLLFGGLGKPVAGSDFFRGRAGAAQVEFTDLRLTETEDGNRDGQTLGGLFFRAVYPGKFRTFLQSLPSGSTVSISALTAALRDSGELRGELVRLDDSVHGRQAVVEGEWQGLVGGLAGGGAWARAVEGPAARNVRTLVAFRGNVMNIAMLSRKERLDLPGVFDGFDFGNCREFCGNARVCLELARVIGENKQVFD